MKAKNNMISLVKMADRHNKNLLYIKGGDFNAARDFLIRKLIEEAGEYCEAVTLDQGDNTRKLTKFGCLDKNNVVDYGKLNKITTEKLHEESTDIMYIAMRIARLEKVSIEEMIERVNLKKDYK